MRQICHGNAQTIGRDKQLPAKLGFEELRSASPRSQACAFLGSCQLGSQPARWDHPGRRVADTRSPQLALVRDLDKDAGCLAPLGFLVDVLIERQERALAIQESRNPVIPASPAIAISAAASPRPPLPAPSHTASTVRPPLRRSTSKRSSPE